MIAWADIATVLGMLGLGGTAYSKLDGKWEKLDAEKLDRNEFDLLVRQIEALHLDVREIRDRMRNGHEY